MKIVIRRLGSDRTKQKTGLKVLATAMFAATLMIAAQPVHSGDESALENIGLLTFETGATDRIALYDDGVFQVPTSTNPPDPGGDAADATQAMVDESAPNKCELDQSPGVVGAEPLVIFSQQGGANVGFVGDSAGVFSRGGGAARGTNRCGRIAGDEKLIMSLGPYFDLDDDGDLDVAANRTHIDAEFKGNAIAIFTARFAGTITGQYYVLSGSNAGGPVPSGLIPGAFEIPCGATNADSNNDSGPSDNCAIEWPFDYGEAGVAPSALWDQLEMEVREGKISFEGGGDHSLSFHNRSEFDLVRVDGILDCQGTFSGSGGGIEGARLDNIDGGCGALIPFSLAYNGEEYILLFERGTEEPNFVLYPIWGLEGLEEPDTLVSWSAAVPDWDTCSDTTDPNCFVLEQCLEGTPFRFCGDSDVGCIDDDFCEDNAEEGDELCLLRNLTPPAAAHHGFPAGQFDDLDSTRDGTQYSCRFEWGTIWVDTVGLDGMLGTGDDTLTPQNYQREGIFIHGDARGRRN